MLPNRAKEDCMHMKYKVTRLKKVRLFPPKINVFRYRYANFDNTLA